MMMKNSGYSYKFNRSFKWGVLFGKMHSRFFNKPYSSNLEKSVNEYVCSVAWDNVSLLLYSAIIDEKVWGVVNRNCKLIDDALEILKTEYHGLLENWTINDVKKFVNYKEPE